MKEIASMIFVNSQGQILLQLRDDKPTIPYPNMWTIPGGTIEEGETPEQAIEREMMEEMGIEAKAYRPFLILIKEPLFTEYVYRLDTDLDVATVKLTEGQRLKWFDKEELNDIQLAFEGNKIINAFVKSKA
jgi:8-oxo-dGTP diphosphatase